MSWKPYFISGGKRKTIDSIFDKKGIPYIYEFRKGNLLAYTIDRHRNELKRILGKRYKIEYAFPGYED